MPFNIVRGNILDIKTDIIVNTTDDHLSGSGGLDMQLHKQAGPWLDMSCRELAPIRPGQAVCTEGFGLNCSYVIHTAAPWYIGLEENFEALRMCYRNSLSAAVKLRQESISFPLIGSGLRAFPKEDVLRIATEEIRSFLIDNEQISITLVVHDMSQYQPNSRLLNDIEHFIWGNSCHECCAAIDEAPSENTLSFPILKASKPAFVPNEDISLDESFSAMVLRKIDEKGISDPECYHKANVDRRVFSKLRSSDSYKPKKTTAVAFAIALELDLDETRELLDKAGYSLSRSLLFDQIIEYCISEEIYDVFLINELLFQYDQALLN